MEAIDTYLKKILLGQQIYPIDILRFLSKIVSFNKVFY